MFALARLAVGLEPSSVRDALASLAPGRLALQAEIRVPRWPRRTGPLSRQRTGAKIVRPAAKASRMTAAEAPVSESARFKSDPVRADSEIGAPPGEKLSTLFRSPQQISVALRNRKGGCVEFAGKFESTATRLRRGI